LAFCNVNPKNNSGKRLEGDLAHYHKFCRHFCHVETLQFRGRRIQKYSGIKEERLEEFKSYLVDKLIRFRVEDVLQDLPEMTRAVVELEVPDTPGLKAEFEAYLAGSKVDVTGKTTSALLKAPATAEYCRELLEGGSGPLVVFTDHIASATEISRGISGSRLITGAVNPEKRAQAVAEFQTGRVSAIVATIGSLSTGVTLTASRHVVFNDLSWVPSDNLQAEKRIHRIGQKNACFSHYVNSTPTDSYIRKTLLQKMETINKILEDCNVRI